MPRAPRVSRRALLRAGLGAGLALAAGAGRARPAAAQARKAVELAFIGPLTGGTASNGLGGRNAFLLAIAERNADPKSRYRYDTQVIPSVSHHCSVVAIATPDSFHKLGLPSMVWGAVLPEITYGHQHVEVAGVNGTMIHQNRIAAEFAVKRLGFRTFSLIPDTTDYGQGHAKYFSEGLLKLGARILSTTGTAKDQKDYTAELTKIKAERPEVIWCGGLTPDGVRVKVPMDKRGIKAQFQGTSGIKSDTFIETAGASAEGVYCFVEGAPTEKLPGGKQFLAAYGKMNFKEPSEAYGPFAYVATHLIIDAIETVGPDRAKVAQRLKRTQSANTIIGPVELDEHGQNTVDLITTHVAQDGKGVVWEDSEYAKGKRELPGLKFKRQRG